MASRRPRRRPPTCPAICSPGTSSASSARCSPPTPRSGSMRRRNVNANKALWEKGDFTRIAASMRESGEELVRNIGVTPGMQVLDLGSGDGTTAVPAAQLGVDVLGVDIASNLVAAGNARAEALGLTNLT